MLLSCPTFIFFSYLLMLVATSCIRIRGMAFVDFKNLRICCREAEPFARLKKEEFLIAVVTWLVDALSVHAVVDTAPKWFQIS